MEQNWHFEAKYLMDYRVLKLLNESSLLLVKPNRKEHKRNVDDMKPCSTLELTEYAWNAFLNPMKTNCQNNEYDLRPHD